MAHQSLPIKNCEFAFKCPRAWERLAATANESERHCASCDKPVYLCQDDEALTRHAQVGHCVAVEDASQEGHIFLGQVKTEYFASGKLDWDCAPEQAPTPNTSPGLKIAPSVGEQRVDMSQFVALKLNWD